MKASKFKELLISALDQEADPGEACKQIQEAGVNFEFTDRFSDKVLDTIFSEGSTVMRELELAGNISGIFYRIAITGVAAIILLLISIFLTEGSLSFNSFLGISNSYDESIISLLTGN